MTDGYTATMLLAKERPDLMDLVTLIYTMGDEAFSDGLHELERRGLIVRSHPLADDWGPA
jgi:hypothetical protein